jgi:hypothetical protein
MPRLKPKIKTPCKIAFKVIALKLMYNIGKTIF